MPSTNFGTSDIWHHADPRFDHAFGPDGSYQFLLSLNVPYGGPARKPKQGEMMTIPPDNERIDDWNHGAVWSPAQYPGMSLCIGAARSGKGAGVIVPNLLTYRGNVVVNDPKGENFWITAERRRKYAREGGLGQKVVLADPFGEVNRAYGTGVGVTETVTKYNPLAELNPEHPDFSEDVAAIGEALTIDLGGGDNSNFFSGSGRDMIDGLIAATVTDAPQGRGTLRNVRQWLNLDNPSFATAVQEYCDKHPNSLGAAKLRQFSDMTDRTNIGVKATAKQQTVFLDSEQLLKYMEPALGEETFSFSELSKGYLDVYLVLPATHTVNYKRWLRMMVNQSMRSVLRHGVQNLGHPVTYFLDEAGTSLGHLDAIESAYGLTSGMGVLCWSFYQDISQMKRDYPNSWQTFIANSATIQLLRIGDLETAKYFSDHIGQGTRATTSSGTTSSWGPGGSSGGSSTNYGETGRPVLMPDEMMRIPAEEMIVMYAGRKPLQQYKIRYFQDGRFNGYYRMDPKRQTEFPTVVPMPPHVKEGTQGWRIEYSNGIGNATYRAPARVPFKLPRWLKLGVLGIVLLVIAYVSINVYLTQRSEAKERAAIASVEAAQSRLPKLTPDVMAAVSKRATEQGQLFKKAKRFYTSRLYDVRVKSSGNGSMTVTGFEDCTNAMNGAPNGWRLVSFIQTKPSANDPWQVTSMSGSPGYPTENDLLSALYHFPRFVLPMPVPDKER